ncbi:cyclin-dependent kinase 11A-like [Spodoptera frugiperda]|uniref:Cyclin-dependent kinase 11A-like n=1 Tax=Spodoptera frugiperda TaxID=7108 RepID=A0A9R0EVG3_SPOFR|nr:cyclin-dependent kinase 11A-like [Spodoptera frugiperda]
MGLVDYDFTTIMQTKHSNKQLFSVEHVKCLMTKLLLKVVQHLHDHHVMHRDLKTSNILLSNKGVLKVADFGMVREYEFHPQQYTPAVVTRWYREPEILLLVKEYSSPVDIWSIDCIFAELIKLRPLFPDNLLITLRPLFLGNSKCDQIFRIFEGLGTPTDTTWPGYSELPVGKITFKNHPTGRLRETMNNRLSDDGLSLLQDFLLYDQAARVTADAALNHPYFEEEPVAMEPAMFLPSLWAEYVEQNSNSDTGEDTQ